MTLKICAGLALLAIVTAAAAAAQGGGVRGRVADAATGQALAGVTATVLDRRGAVLCSDVTGADGAYLLDCTPAGEFLIRTTRLGHAGEERLVTVPAGGWSTADFRLSPGAELLEPVVVTGSRYPRTLGTVSASLTVLTAADIDEHAPTDVAEALRGIPGLAVARGSSAGFNLGARGFNSSADVNRPR